MNGVICIDKSAGMTSFDVVAALRRLCRERKVGHAGTLDPMATGVLPVFFGEATKAISLLPCQDKRYTASLRLGVTTDTGDTTGRVLTETAVTVTRQAVENAVSRFCGEIEQVPPMYSALKSGGRHLYEIARAGGEVERQPRRITVHSIAVVGRNADTGDYLLDVSCSKGTYIRTLCEDIGKALGCGGTMSALRRTFAAGFDISECKTLEEIKKISEENNIENNVLDVETVFRQLPEICVSVNQAVRFRNGGALSFDRLEGAPARGLCRVICAETFIGIGQADAEKRQIAVKCHFNRGAAVGGGEGT